VIVKIQIALAGSHENKAMVYNEDRSVFFFMDATDDIREAVGSTMREFFEVEIVDGTCLIGKWLPEQGW
jgi:hypothetical protein